MFSNLSNFNLALSLAAVFLVIYPASSATLDRRTKKSVSPLLQSKIRSSRPIDQSHRAPQLILKGNPLPEVVIPFQGNIDLECEAGGSPPPTIHWLKDGVRLGAEEADDLEPTYQNNKDEDVEFNLLHPNIVLEKRSESLGLTLTRSRLTLECFTPKDVGKYTCVAENPYQRVSADSQVTLGKGSSSNEQCSKNLETSGGLTQPRIHMWTHTRLELIGNDLRLFCRASGVPQPEITWLGPGGALLENGFRFQVLPNGDLKINNLTWKDMGSYVCVAENSMGSDRISTFVYPAKPETTD